MSTGDQALFLKTILRVKLGKKIVTAQRDNRHTNPVETRWKSTLKANMKGVTSRVTHAAKSYSGYMKHSTGRGLDSIRIFRQLGMTLPESALARAKRKRAMYKLQSSEDTIVRRRRVVRRKDILNNVYGIQDTAYQGKGKCTT